MSTLIPQSASFWLMILFLGGAAAVATAAALTLRKAPEEGGVPTPRRGNCVMATDRLPGGIRELKRVSSRRPVSIIHWL